MCTLCKVVLWPICHIQAVPQAILNFCIIWYCASCGKFWPSFSIFNRQEEHYTLREKCWIDVHFLHHWMLRSAVGKTHDLRSDLWWTLPLRSLLDHFGIPFGSQYSEIDHIHLSVSAIIYPRWTATLKKVEPKWLQSGTIWNYLDFFLEYHVCEKTVLFSTKKK